MKLAEIRCLIVQTYLICETNAEPVYKYKPRQLMNAENFTSEGSVSNYHVKMTGIPEKVMKYVTQHP